MKVLKFLGIQPNFDLYFEHMKHYLSWPKRFYGEVIANSEGLRITLNLHMEYLYS